MRAAMDQTLARITDPKIARESKPAAEALKKSTGVKSSMPPTDTIYIELQKAPLARNYGVSCVY
jgi:hypothetical protein